jgi:hypothetical protein
MIDMGEPIKYVISSHQAELIKHNFGLSDEEIDASYIIVDEMPKIELLESEL